MNQGLGWLLVLIVWVLIMVIIAACAISQLGHIIIATISIVKPKVKVLSVFNIILYIVSALFVLGEIGIIIFAYTTGSNLSYIESNWVDAMSIVIFVTVQTILFIVSRIRRHKYLKSIKT